MARTWILRLYLKRMRAEGRKFIKITAAERRLVLDWAFVAHETMYAVLHHHSRALTNNPPHTLDTAQGFVDLIEDKLGHPFTSLDLHQLHDEILDSRDDNFHGRVYGGKKGGVEDVPGSRLLTWFNYDRELDADNLLVPFTMKGIFDARVFCALFGVPRPSAASHVFKDQL